MYILIKTGKISTLSHTVYKLCEAETHQFWYHVKWSPSPEENSEHIHNELAIVSDSIERCKLLFFPPFIYCPFSLRKHVVRRDRSVFIVQARAGGGGGGYSALMLSKKWWSECTCMHAVLPNHLTFAAHDGRAVGWSGQICSCHVIGSPRECQHSCFMVSNHAGAVWKSNKNLI